MNQKYIAVVILLICICGASAFVFMKKSNNKSENVVKNDAPTLVPTVEPTLSPSPSPTPKVMLPSLIDYYNKNKDTIGWIKIDGTKINYPVMFTPGDNEFYLKRDFNKNASIRGTLYIDAESKISTPNTNIIIYGHNMKDDSMFGSLSEYKSKSYYDKHPRITFNTLYEEGTYEIFGAFYAKVLRKSDTTSFRYYQYKEAKTEEEYNKFVEYVKKVRQYDTGVQTSYGDRFITLSTCSYHVENGRFAVVARKVTQ